MTRHDLYAHFAPARTALTISEFMERRLEAGNDDPHGAENLEKALDYSYVKALAGQAEAEDAARSLDES